MFIIPFSEWKIKKRTFPRLRFLIATLTIPPDWEKTLLSAVDGNCAGNIGSSSSDLCEFSLPVFNPLIDDVKCWISEIKDTAAHWNWDYKKILIHGPGYLSVAAKRWYNSLRHAIVRIWVEFKAAIESGFPLRCNAGGLLKAPVLLNSASQATYDKYAR